MFTIMLPCSYIKIINEDFYVLNFLTMTAGNKCLKIISFDTHT